MRLVATAAFAVAIMLSACSSSDDSATAGAGAASGPAPDTVEYFNQVVGDRVFFATDQHSLDTLARSTLDRQAQWLQTNPGTTVMIEGHADERGTRQYNLALGARRANSVRQYLIQNGVPANRLDSVTYGKERPVALCSDESCWSQNRRGVSVVAGAPTS